MSMAKSTTYPGYTGKKKWSVHHPRHAQPITVTAPTELTALVAAANGWGERWQSIEFYTAVTVTPA